MKSIDSWTAGCYATVFLAMAEYCIVLYLTKYSDWEKKVIRYKKNNPPGAIKRKVQQKFANKINTSEKIKVKK